MTGEEFWDQLRRAGRYETPAGRGAAWLPSLRYYLRSLGQVFRGCSLARRGGFDRAAFASESFRTVEAIEACGGRLSISGVHHFTALSGPVVFVANHMSMLETFLLPTLILPFKPVAFVLKESLTRYPLFGVVLKSIDKITVTRRNPMDDFRRVLSEGTRLVQSGISIMVFPQATRTTRLDPAAFNTLGVKLAARAGAPVIPIALRTDFQGTGRLWKDFGPIDPRRTVHVRFGPPLTIKGNGKAEHRQVIAFIATSLREWGIEVAEPAGRPRAASEGQDEHIMV